MTQSKNNQKITHRGRDISWLPVVQFHKEIVARAERGFFSLSGQDDQSERWSSLKKFDPKSLSGPWELNSDTIHSSPFKHSLEQNTHESIFIGGPCFLGWEKGFRGGWHPQWRPLLYREVSIDLEGTPCFITPKQGSWGVTPLLYSILDRLEARSGDSLEDLAVNLIEKASAYKQSEQRSFHESVFRALFAEIADLEEEFTKPIREDSFKVKPSPWVLFAPASNFSALTRHLMSDYEKLEESLQSDPDNLGGIRLLEDHLHDDESSQVEPMPLIPLNDSQDEAVKAMLGKKPLTVVSGPPGTGKSQVVVSVLLNAWARGMTVLFASNNNKAVDVVRERVEHFEAEFPLAVRAGSREKQNIQEVLRRTLNMAAGTKTHSEKDPDQTEDSINHKDTLVDRRKNYQQMIESQLPQRIDESKKTALSAYAAYRKTLAYINERETELEQQKIEIGFETERSIESIETQFKTSEEWVKRQNHFQSLIKKDEENKKEIKKQLHDHERKRNKIASTLGFELEENEGWNWLLNGPNPELLMDWEKRIRSLLSEPVEQKLETFEWNTDFDKWKSEEEARSWESKGVHFAEKVKNDLNQLTPKLEEVSKLKIVRDKKLKSIEENKIPENIQIETTQLQSWNNYFIELKTIEKSKFDFLPWSAPNKIRKKLRNIERGIKGNIPIEIWNDIGVLNDEGREMLAPLIEIIKQWIEIKFIWDSKQNEIREIIDDFRNMRITATELKLNNIPSGAKISEWRKLIQACETEKDIASKAAEAWKRQKEKQEIEKKLGDITQNWIHTCSGVPLRETWIKGQGLDFHDSVKRLQTNITIQNVIDLRTNLYSGGLGELINVWQKLIQEEESITNLKSEFDLIPSEEDRLSEWWHEKPEDALFIQTKPSNWPGLDSDRTYKQRIKKWINEANNFFDSEKPDAETKSNEELNWAISKLKQSVKVLPEGVSKKRVEAIQKLITDKSDEDWPIDEINEAFSDFSPEKIQNLIEQINVELEKISFEDAKASWVKRLKDDHEAIRSVDLLEKKLRQNKGAIPETMHQNFRDALRLVPIWITTAQAPQAIPLEPELFDLVVIDEASQCTLTNLLPLVFRGKRLAVIGDDNQLPAIPTIQENEQNALAKKFEVEEHLSLIGHASNDVYKTACETLPRRRADVLMLIEHFRSNPQIIGFSNRHIYLQRLELKKDPALTEKLPIASGVTMIEVTGQVYRGPRGRSWINRNEANRVLELIKQLRKDARNLSLGVVTPFAAQKDFLRDELNTLRLSSEVLVDTAYGFQGDERDVIIFSPVVGKGISSSASRWVENPPNLINVALTRAREALYVVADFEYCLQSQGILRKLALYCKDIQLLRDTSPAELELFSWMMLKGWDAKVHQRIGDLEVDFVLSSKTGERIVIEVDGAEFHKERTESDKARDAYLQGQGYKVQRFAAREVFETPFEVVHQIDQLIAA